MALLRGRGRAVKLDFTRLLHGYQGVTQHRAVPPNRDPDVLIEHDGIDGAIIQAETRDGNVVFGPARATVARD
ncbi:MAG: hypothetical protein GY929_25815 [Actinomycetia bacterium]|nr:hypothetical protein [Actinomycetes bacterium]